MMTRKKQNNCSNPQNQTNCFKDNFLQTTRIRNSNCYDFSTRSHIYLHFVLIHKDCVLSIDDIFCPT